jgi:hypothetical protein
MPVPMLLLVAVAALTGLALLRWARVHAGLEPYPEVMLPFIIAFLVLPPIALGIIVRPGGDPLGGLGSVLPYAGMVTGLATLLWIASRIARLLPFGRPRSVLLLALIGSEGHPDDVAVDPPVTKRLAENIAAVDKTNAAFPRGIEFPVQIDRTGFRAAWDALDTATTKLEAGIVADARRGLAVASAASATADDARGRLDTLRSLALEAGQSWAVAAAQPAPR